MKPELQIIVNSEKFLYVFIIRIKRGRQWSDNFGLWAKFSVCVSAIRSRVLRPIFASESSPGLANQQRKS